MLPLILVNPDLDERISWLKSLALETGLSLTGPDLLWINPEEKIGVEKVRELKQFLSLKPYQSTKIGAVLCAAEAMSIEAQNALLKLLEEPPEKAVLYLGVNNLGALLPTVLSRCQIIDFKNGKIPDSVQEDQQLTELLQKGIDLRLQAAEKITDKPQFINRMLNYFRAQMLKKPQDNQTVYIVEEIINTYRYLEANVNERALLDNLLIMIPSN